MPLSVSLFATLGVKLGTKANFPDGFKKRSKVFRRNKSFEHSGRKISVLKQSTWRYCG